MLPEEGKGRDDPDLRNMRVESCCRNCRGVGVSWPGVKSSWVLSVSCLFTASRVLRLDEASGPDERAGEGHPNWYCSGEDGVSSPPCRLALELANELLFIGLPREGSTWSVTTESKLTSQPTDVLGECSSGDWSTGFLGELVWESVADASNKFVIAKSMGFLRLSHRQSCAFDTSFCGVGAHTDINWGGE